MDTLSSREERILKSITGGDRLLEKKFSTKVQNASKASLLVGLTTLDYAALLYAAKITAEDVSISGYHLARLKDCGDYVRKNCRFLSAEENIAERRSSETQRETARKIGASIGKANFSLGQEARLRKRAALKVSDPKKFRELYENVGKHFAQRAIERDREFLKKSLPRRSLEIIGYPESGWKSRFVFTVGVSRGFLAGLLARNPGFEESLKEF